MHREGIVRNDGVMERVIFLLLGFLAFCQHPPSIHPRNVGAKGTSVGRLGAVNRTGPMGPVSGGHGRCGGSGERAQGQ